MMRSEEIVNTFIENVAALKEADYGDFKRKANSYLLRMEDGLRTSTAQLPEAAQRQILAIKEALVYQPSFNVAATQRETLKRAENLKTLVP